MAFPHQQSRQDHDRKEDKPSNVSILRKFVKRTVDIAVYRNADNDVNPARNFALVRITDHGLAFDSSFGGAEAPVSATSIPCAFPPVFLLCFGASRRWLPNRGLGAKLFCVLRHQSLPGGGLHGIGARDASNRLTGEKTIQHIEADVPARSAP